MGYSGDWKPEGKKNHCSTLAIAVAQGKRWTLDSCLTLSRTVVLKWSWAYSRMIQYIEVQSRQVERCSSIWINLLASRVAAVVSCPQ